MGQDSVCVGHKDKNRSRQDIWCLHGRKRYRHQQEPINLIRKQHKRDAIKNLRHEDIKSTTTRLAPCHIRINPPYNGCDVMFFWVFYWLKIVKETMRWWLQLQEGILGCLRAGSVCQGMRTKIKRKRYSVCRSVCRKGLLRWGGVMGMSKFSTIEVNWW